MSKRKSAPTRVTARVSEVAALPAVREWVNAQQRRAVAEHPEGVVVDGRDIGTVVFPDAPLKVFLTASPDERARRRLSQRGDRLDDDRVARESRTLADRDRVDASRPVAPAPGRGRRRGARFHADVPGRTGGARGRAGAGAPPWVTFPSSRPRRDAPGPAHQTHYPTGNRCWPNRRTSPTPPPNQPPRSAPTPRFAFSPAWTSSIRRTRSRDVGDVRGNALEHRRRGDRQVEGAPRDRHRRHPRRRVQVGRRRRDRRVQGSQEPQGGRRGRGVPRAPRGSGGRGRAVQEEGRLHAGVGEDPRGLREGRAGDGHAGQEDQGRRGRRPDGRRRVPAGQPDRAAARAEHRRAAGPELRVQDHQAEQAPPQHRRVAPRAARGRAQDQARSPDEGAAGRPGAERRRQEHHRLRRLHRSGRRGRPAAHHRHELRPRVASERDGPARPGARGQDPGHRLGARAHLARPEAAAGVSVEGRRREVPGRHARPGQGGVDHQLRRLRRARAGHRRAWCTSPR